MNNLKEIYVAKKDKNIVMAKIDTLCRKYHNRIGVNDEQRKALFRSYCHDTIEVFEECFETTMLGMKRYINKVEDFRKRDNINLEAASLIILNMLMDLKGVVIEMIPIKDLPSCKKLTELSHEDAVSKAKDLVKNDIVKAGISTLLLGLKICDVVTIYDVRRYYQNCLEELQNEIQIKANQISPIEQFLFDKFKAELGYCHLAMFKTGIGAAKELNDLVEIAKKDIERYEQKQLVNCDNIVVKS
ncbi:MAG: hypothetical protein IJK87_15760 [Prevotella sp.]|nr:hypothetical protein [Prevotella sp.]